MFRSSTEVIGTQLAGLLFAVILLTTICLASTAEPAMLTAQVHPSICTMHVYVPLAAVYSPAPDGTFEFGAYLAVSSMCQTLAICFGVPVTVPGVPGFLVEYSTVPAVVAAPSPAFRVVEQQSRMMQESGMIVPEPGEPGMRSEKSWTARSGQR